MSSKKQTQQQPAPPTQPTAPPEAAKPPDWVPNADGIMEHRFDTWEDFKSAFCRLLFCDDPFQRHRYLFRGHRDAAWKLLPAFDRMFSDQPKSKRLEIAAEMLRTFKRSLEGLELPQEARGGDDNLYLALGQHHGLPTRLLDWTESPYVAAFFAYNNSSLLGAPDNWIAIWVLDTTHPIWSAQYGVEIIDVPLFGNQRIRNQSGKFTLSKTPFSTLEDYVKAHGDGGDPLRKFLLPASDAGRALADLDAMGINHGTVYPEFEGAAQTALFRAAIRHKTYVQATPARPT